MDESLHFSERQDVHTFATITNSPFFTDNRHIIESLFVKSLEAKHGAYPLFDIQSELLGHIIAAESARKKYLRWKNMYAKAQSSLISRGAPLARIRDAQARIDFTEEAAMAAKWVVSRLRSIGDGIAWWFFDYDRANLRVIVEHDAVSVPVVGTGLLSEIAKFASLVAEGRKVLLNAITNFLRTGDITVYDEASGEYQLIEIKTGKKRDSRVMRQKEHLALVQNAIDTGSHSLTGHRISKIRADRPLLTYATSLENTLREAQTDFCSSRKFGEYLSFVVFNMHMLGELPIEEAEAKSASELNRMMSVRRRDDVMLPTMSSMLPTVHFSRMLVPYVVFPIAPDLRLGLLTGDFCYFSQMNISGLARWLRRRGWKADALTIDAAEPKLGQFNPVFVLQVSKPSARNGVRIPLDILCAAAHEFWMPESIERLIEAGISRKMPEGDYAACFKNTGKYAWD